MMTELASAVLKQTAAEDQRGPRAAEGTDQWDP